MDRSSYWCVCRTHPRREQWARQNVEAQGHQAYLPLLRPDKRHEIKRIRALFPSYLFVNITGPYSFLWSTFGIAWPIISTGYSLAKIPNEVIDELRDREGIDGMIALPDHRFRHNQAVRVRRGPFADRIGLFQGMSGKDRVKVLFDTLGITIADELLEAA